MCVYLSPLHRLRPLTSLWLVPTSDEDTDVGALVKSWLSGQPQECRANLENWLGDYFHRALDWVLKQVSTTLLSEGSIGIMDSEFYLKFCYTDALFYWNYILIKMLNLRMNQMFEIKF